MQAAQIGIGQCLSIGELKFGCFPDHALGGSPRGRIVAPATMYGTKPQASAQNSNRVHSGRGIRRSRVAGAGLFPAGQQPVQAAGEQGIGRKVSGRGLRPLRAGR